MDYWFWFTLVKIVHSPEKEPNDLFVQNIKIGIQSCKKRVHAWLYRGQILELWMEKGALSFEDSSQGHPESYTQAKKNYFLESKKCLRRDKSGKV